MAHNSSFDDMVIMEEPTHTYDTHGTRGIHVNTGRWTHEEHLLFVKGLRRFGRDWKRVVDLVPRRTTAQIRSHAQKYFKKLAKQDRSTIDPIIAAMMDKHTTEGISPAGGSADDEACFTPTARPTAGATYAAPSSPTWHVDSASKSTLEEVGDLEKQIQQLCEQREIMVNVDAKPLTGKGLEVLEAFDDRIKQFYQVLAEVAEGHPDVTDWVNRILVSAVASVTNPPSSTTSSGRDLSALLGASVASRASKNPVMLSEQARPAKRRRVESDIYSKSYDNTIQRPGKRGRRHSFKTTPSSSSAAEMQELEFSALEMLSSVGEGVANDEESDLAAATETVAPLKETVIESPECHAATQRAMYGFNPDLFRMQMMTRDPLSGAIVMTPMPFTIMTPMCIGPQFGAGPAMHMMPTPAPFPPFMFQQQQPTKLS